MLIDVDEDPRFRTVTFAWAEDDPGNPAKDVFIRLIPIADDAHERGDLTPYLMDQEQDGLWRKAIRLEAGFRCSYQLCIVRDEAIRGVAISEERLAEIFAMGIVDPRNPLTIGPCTYGNTGWASILELPEATRQPWYEAKDNVPRGVVERVELGQSVVHVYRPSGYPECLAILFDGRVWMAIDGASTLDNLMAAGAIPPTVTVLIESMHGATRQEMLTQPGIFQNFVLHELLPWVRANYDVTADPRRSLIGGQSLGGLAATYLGLVSGSFGLVLTQSGSFWRDRTKDEEVDSAEIMEAFRDGPKQQVRFYQDAGVLEGNLLDKNRDLHAILVERGYEVSYREFEGGHDYAWWRGGLADGLIALLGTAEKPV